MLRMFRLSWQSESSQSASIDLVLFLCLDQLHTCNMDSQAGEAASTLQGRPHRKTRKRAPLLRLYRLLVSRLSTPLLTSLFLLSWLPSTNRHIVFELIPFYKSLRCLVLTPACASSTPAYRKSIQQWLSYWTVYTFVRFLEATRCNVSTSSQRREALQNALDRLPRVLGERILRLFSSARRKSNTTVTYTTSLPRDMTLATQIAGSSTRWTVIKAILLFYAMDEELQGARRIMQKIIKPFFAFFTSLDEEDYEDMHAIPRNTEEYPSRGTLDEDGEQVTGRSTGSLKLNLEEKQDEKTDEDEVCMSRFLLSRNRAIFRY